MCRTRIKVIDEYTTSEELEVAVNMFIADPLNKVAKVNSVKFEVYYDEDDDPCMFAVINYDINYDINYELGGGLIMTKLYLLYSRYLTEGKINHEYLMIITSSKQKLNTQIKNLFTKNSDEQLRLEVWEHANDEYLQVLSKDLARGDYID